MTDARTIEGRISLWMEAEEAGTHYPDRLLSATFEQTRELRQGRSFRWSFPVVRSPRSLAAASAAAVVLVVVGALGLNFAVSPPGPASSPSPSPTVAPTSSPRTSSPPGYMWPQSTLEDVRAAQELAKVGDPRYTWQVARDLDQAQLSQHHPGDAKIFPRFLQEVLGWEQFLDGHHVPRKDMAGLDDGEFVYIRCAPGGTNPLYSTDPKGARCAPTIDALRYETVKITVAQPDHQGAFGIWVVTGWEMIGPAAQADSRVEEAEATALLEDFLRARVNGDGAEELTELPGGLSDEEIAREIPLLYATSTGAPYERSEFELVDGPTWPHGRMQFEVRLFADNDETVVEQHFSTVRDETGRLRVDLGEPAAIENGEAVPVEYGLLDGEVTFRAAAPLAPRADEYREVAIEGLVPDDFAPLLMLADPTPFAPSCVEAQGPADAEALARIIGSGTKWEATAPVDVTIGGISALRMDVVLAPGATTCTWSEGDISEFGPLLKYARFEMEDRARLYLVDLPEGSQARVLAIVIITDEDSFETVLEAAAPVIDSIEFHVP